MSQHGPERESSEPAARRSAASQSTDGPRSGSVDHLQPSESIRHALGLLPQSTSTPSPYLQKTSNDPPPAKVPKVAIPRLPHKSEYPSSGTKLGGRHRVVHACEPCRARKTKCSGEKPACKHCQHFKVTCLYADGKRDRAKNLAEKVADYEAVLEALSSRVGEEDGNLIKTLLRKDTASRYDDSSATEDAAREPDLTPERIGPGSEISGGAGSTGAQDRIEEDFNRSEQARSTGYMGKNSEITWIQKLKQQTKHATSAVPDERAELRSRSGRSSPASASRSSQGGSRKTMADASEGFSVNESSYHLDDFSVFVPETVDQYELPIRGMADSLFNAYMESVHPSFPIIGRITFAAQYKKFVEDPTSNPGERWLAILNLIFALGARYSHLVHAEWRGDERDHLIYFSRARLLSMNGMTIFNHPDLQQVQVSGLVAFYLLATSQINRAWTICGIALRAAVALGLNFRNESARTPDTSKEIRCRVWWALYSLEYQLSLMTGRHSSVFDQACTVPLPIPIEEDAFQTQLALTMLGTDMQKTARYPGLSFRGLGNSRTPTTSSSDPSADPTLASKRTSTSRSPSSSQTSDVEWTKSATPSASLYFLHSIRLTKIAQSTLDWLYTPEALLKTWSYIQSVIYELNQMITDWHGSLPGIFDFKRKQRDKIFMQQRMCLGFYYYSTRIIVNRPCLCRLDRKMPSQSTRSKELNRVSATTCIDAAREMLQMLPDEPNAVGLNRVGPWWCVIHYLVQAATVVLLELSYRSDHMPEEAENIFEAAQKALRWLHSLGEENPSARRAWALCNNLLRETAPKIGRHVTRLPEYPPGPLNERPYSGTASSHSMPAMSAPLWTPSGLQSGANFRVAQQDLTNLPIASGYDQYSSFSATDSNLQFFPTSADMEFINHEHSDPEPSAAPRN